MNSPLSSIQTATMAENNDLMLFADYLYPNEHVGKHAESMLFESA